MVQSESFQQNFLAQMNKLEVNGSLKKPTILVTHKKGSYHSYLVKFENLTPSERVSR